MLHRGFHKPRGSTKASTGKKEKDILEYCVMMTKTEPTDIIREQMKGCV